MNLVPPARWSLSSPRQCRYPTRGLLSHWSPAQRSAARSRCWCRLTAKCPRTRPATTSPQSSTVFPCQTPSLRKAGSGQSTTSRTTPANRGRRRDRPDNNRPPRVIGPGHSADRPCGSIDGRGTFALPQAIRESTATSRLRRRPRASYARPLTPGGPGPRNHLVLPCCPGRQHPSAGVHRRPSRWAAGSSPLKSRSRCLSRSWCNSCARPHPPCWPSVGSGSTRRHAAGRRRRQRRTTPLRGGMGQPVRGGPAGASSGKVTRHRLNRGGSRNANQALWRIALTGGETGPGYRLTPESGCPWNDLPSHRPEHQPSEFGPIRACPPHRSGPSLSCQHLTHTARIGP